MTDQENIILLTDSYKMGHGGMYPKNTESVYSYYESRTGAEYPFTKFFGLQIILQRYLVGKVVTQEKIDEAEKFCALHFGTTAIFNKAMWQHILDVHKGYLPIRIKAVPEGTKVPVGNIMMSVENTGGPLTAPLTNFLETLLTHVWHASNVATISAIIHGYLKTFFDRTSDNPDMLPFMLHDFGFRGVSSVESAAMGGAGHLTNFMGTDTIPAITYVKRYYDKFLPSGLPDPTFMPGYSVAATEHSVMTALGEEGEFEIVQQLLDHYPAGILSVVSDSYNIDRALDQYGTTFKEQILARDGKFVVRPDSPRFKGEKPEEQIIFILEKLAGYFGYTVNSKGYKVLNPKIGVLYGDGLTLKDISYCIMALKIKGWAAESCVYGMGGGLLQKHDRDTQRNAFKSSAQKRKGKWHDVYKKPLDETKASKRGKQILIKNDIGQYITVMKHDDIGHTEHAGLTDLLVTVFQDGHLIKDYTWDEVLENGKK